MKDNKLDSLWELYNQNKSDKNLNNLCLEYLPRLKKLTCFVYRKFFFNRNGPFTIEDFFSECSFEMVRYIKDKFQSDKGVKFWLYFNPKPFFILLDMHRKESILTRSEIEAIVKFNRIKQLYECCSFEQVKDQIGEEADKAVRAMRFAQTIYIDKYSQEEIHLEGSNYWLEIWNEKKGIDIILNRIFIQKLLQCLNTREKDVIKNYYLKDLSLIEISAKYKCSKSWTSQVKIKAIKKMRCYANENFAVQVQECLSR